MTKTYNDVEAVTRLLDEKEKDLELAARIGQGLLARNKALEERLVTVEVELTTAHDTVTQLKHDLLLKSELLQIYTNDFDDSSPEGVRAFTCDLLQRRVKGLEDANRKLRAEASQLASDSTETEIREEQILQNLANQLAEANNHIKNQDDELANKYEESCKQREEITSLIGQLVSQKHKIRELTLENEELVLQLRVVRDCQNELASELSDYKDKYAECLAMMRETQEQLKQQNKRSMPTASNVSGLSRGASTSYHPDSLASELELSSLGSDGWPSDFSLPPPTNHTTANHTRHPFQRVFDTVRCAGQATPVSLPLAPGTPSSSGPARVTMHTSTPLSETCPPPLLKAQSVLAKLTSACESEYPATSKIGVPGTPGTVDLIHALRRLTPKTSGAYSTAAAADSHGWRTPDSVMSTGSRSALSSMNSFQCNPERLKIIKPMEGSTTLHNWSRLATPHLGSLLEDRPGVATRETDSRRLTSYQPAGLECTGDLLEYSLFDVEEDEELEYPYGNYASTGATYTYTNSTALRSDTLTRATSSSIPSAYMGLTTDYPSLDPSINTQLAHSSAEKGSNARAYSKSAEVLDTPNNSPDITAPGTPPSYYGAFSLLQQGAKMIRRTWTGEETPYSPEFHAVPRISMKELEVLSDMNLMEKLEKLGLDEVAQHSSAISPTALLAALESLAFSHCYASSSEPATTLEPTAAPMRRNNSAQSMEDGATTAKKSPLHRSTSHSIPMSSGLNVICDIGSPLDSVASTAACFDAEKLAKTVDGPSAFYVGARDSHFAAAPDCRTARVGQI